MKKLASRYMRYALPLCLTFIMTFLVSGVATIRALGLVEGVLAKWAESWLVSWCIAFPTMLFMMPVVRRWLGHVFED